MFFSLSSCLSFDWPQNLCIFHKDCFVLGRCGPTCPPCLTCAELSCVDTDTDGFQTEWHASIHKTDHNRSVKALSCCHQFKSLQTSNITYKVLCCCPIFKCTKILAAFDFRNTSITRCKKISSAVGGGLNNGVVKRKERREQKRAKRRDTQR